MKHSKLLKFLLAPFFMFLGEGEGGGAAEDRGDTIMSAAPEIDPDPIVDPLKKDEGVDEVKDETKTDEVKDETKTDEVKDETKTDDDKKKNARIPLARHEAILEKGRLEREALVAQIAELRAGKQAAATNDKIEETEGKLVAMEAEYNKMLADGDIAKATAKMTEIRRLERTIGDEKATLQAQISEARAVERVRYETTADRLEAAFPQIDPKSDDYDQDVVDEVLDVKSAFEAKGEPASLALQKAVKYVLGTESKKQEKAVEVVPKEDKEAAAAALAAARKAEALKRNVDAQNKAPASANKVGTNNEDGGALTAEKAIKLPTDKFEKLGEEELSKLRGDTL